MLNYDCTDVVILIISYTYLYRCGYYLYSHGYICVDVLLLFV